MRNFFSYDFWRREYRSLAFSGIVTLCLFLFVTSTRNSSTLELDLPVEIRGLEKGVFVRNMEGLRVKSVIRGPSSLVAKIATRPPPVKISVAGSFGGSYKTALSPQQIDLPPYVDLISLDPTFIELQLDIEERVIVPVVVPRVGSLSDDWELESITVEPKVVEVRGIREKLSKIRVVESESFDLSELVTKSGEVQKILQTGELGSGTISPSEVTVRYSLREATTTKRLDNIPVTLHSEVGTRTLSQKVSVIIRGARRKLPAESSQVKAIVRAPAKGRPTQLPVEITVPDGVTVEKVEPAYVKTN